MRDCRYHLNDGKGKEQESEPCIFITERDSASGSITKSRDVNTQAVFSLRGKPLNSFGLTKKVVYENEEFNLLQAALNIEDGIEGLRYNKVIAATDADVDGIKHGQLLYSGRTTEIVGTKGLEEVFMEMNGDEISVTPTKE